MRPARVIRSAIVIRPSTVLGFHQSLRSRKYRSLFSPTRRRTGPKGPSKELVNAIVEIKRRNPTWGCPRIAQQITLAFGAEIDKDVVRRVLAARYQRSSVSVPRMASQSSGAEHDRGQDSSLRSDVPSVYRTVDRHASTRVLGSDAVLVRP